MKRIAGLGCMALFGIVALYGQKPNDTLFTYGPHAVLVDEFERGFLKNQDLERDKPGADKVDEYRRLYPRFKLKVQDAYDLRMDTLPEFIRELNGYRRQLARPYLSDREVSDALLVEGYERMRYEVSTSHILILSRTDDLPEDTLRAWNKIQAIAAELAANPGRFNDIAREKSEDPSAKDNGGDLGFFTAFQFVYPYESMAYQTEPGQISKVFRTNYGYHILRVNARRPNAGSMKVAHLMLRLTPNAGEEEIIRIKAKMDEIYAESQKGVAFEDLVARWSEDFTTKPLKGEMDYFYSTAHLNGDLTSEFTDAAFRLSRNGEVSQPFRTAYGWHLIRRLDLKPLPAFDDMKAILRQNIANDSRSYKSTRSMIEKIRKEYGFKEYPENLTAFSKTVDTSVLQAKWLRGKGPQYDLVLFELGNEKYTADFFAGYVVANQRPSKLRSVPALLSNHYSNWSDVVTLDYLDRRLPEKFPEFRYLYQEYKEGILLFNLAQEKVWNKAVLDTTGLRNFFDENRSKYVWNDRFDVTIYNARTQAIMKAVVKQLKKGISDDSIYRFHTKESQLNLSIQEGKFEEQDSNVFVNEIFANKAKFIKRKNYTHVMGRRVSDDQWIVLKIHGYLPSQPKELEETKGPAISDYQNRLEEAWVQEMQTKYPVRFREDTYQALRARYSR
ncbi:MAG: peptidylprolyl isomerase [Bacteroidia bacterium]